MKRGFTLIELLIVVAIIAILAAIAVPNFLEAQTRAKVSRAKTDLRTLVTGLEAYTVDHNKPPVDYDVADGDPEIPEMGITAANGTSGIPHPGAVIGGTLRAGLTTPVAYITNAWYRDPFVSAADHHALIAADQQIFTYNYFIPVWGRPVSTTYVTNKYEEYYGAWRVGSIGPDRNWYNEPGATSGISKACRVYDPTNGTVSAGNIWRSQKEPDVKGRPPMIVTADPNG